MSASAPDDPFLGGRVFDLLDRCFPGIRARARFMRRCGVPWEESSTPLLHVEGETVISHVGVIEIPMMLDGRAQVVGGIHAVCTHPHHRLRGHFGRLMERTLAWCAGRFETLLLTTGQPELYEPFGFQVVPEQISRFRIRCERGAPAPPRRLDMDVPEDRRIVYDLLERRIPLSLAAGVVRERAVFTFHASSHPLYHLEDLDMIVSCFLRGESLHVYDIAWAAPATLDEILARIPGPVSEVDLYAPPDRFPIVPDEVVDYRSADLLMVRGPFPNVRPFMLPPCARC